MARRLITVLIAAAALFVPTLAGTAGAVPTPPIGRVGTPSAGIIARASLDTFTDFVIVDIGQVATQNGELTNIEYWAQATGTIQFLLVDASNVVRWESSSVSVASTGLKTDTLSTPVAISAGWRLGYYDGAGAGVIPYTCALGQSSYEETGDNSGLPSVGSSIPVQETNGCSGPGPEGRTYSMGANIYPVSTTLDVSATVSQWKVLDGLIVFHASLTSQTTNQGIGGQMITFSLNGPDRAGCTSTTDRSGFATCNVVVRPLFAVALIHSFTASFGGSGNIYQGSSATGSVHF